MRALSLGELAAEALAQNWPAKVIGVTSGGVFVLAREQWVLFLTYSPFRAPGTINLERSLVDLKENDNGSSVILGKSQVSFPDSGFFIDMSGAVVWDGGQGGTVSPEQKVGLRKMLEKAALAASEQKGDQGLAPVLHWLVGQGDAVLAGDMTEKILADLTDMRIAIKEGRVEGFLDAAQSMIGRGRGLTPATDDCIAGVLLTLNRWKGIVDESFNLAAVNEAVVSLARVNTTSLSTTIIHAATLGQGDERILRVLDEIMSENLSQKAIHDLVQMGHSSGVDSLVGITLALTA